MTYEPWPVFMGVYKHHQGSSRHPRNWIKEIRRSWGLEQDDYIVCAAAGCENDTTTHRFEGCHLAESRLKEALSIFGIGGTPVVALCSACHDKTGAAIMIGNIGMGIIDTNCPADLRKPKPGSEITNQHILCNNCGTYDTKGPDEDDHWYCVECGHHIDSDGDCCTDNCQACDDDDDDDDEWVPSCNECDSDEDVSDPGGDYYYCSNCELEIDDEGDSVSEDVSCPWCDDYEETLVLCTQDDEYEGQRIYTCCCVYFDENGNLWPDENPNGDYCRFCGENLYADDCPKELCGTCCDGSGCSRHGDDDDDDDDWVPTCKGCDDDDDVVDADFTEVKK